MLLSQFGEDVIYYPFGAEPRSITAIVEREPPAIYNASGNAVMPKAVVRMLNSRQLGVASSEVDNGGDQIGMALNIGGDVKTFSVMQMQSQDSGVTVLAVM